jgi:hypothetical protein
MVKTNIQTFSGEVEILSNLHVGNYLTANGTASNVLDITGNVGATFFVGDGGFLSNIATTLNDIVANPGGNTVSNTLVFESGADVTSNTAIVTYANVGISISNTEPTGEFQLSIGSNIFVNTHASNVLTIIGSVGANTFIGDGGFLSNIATTLDDIISNPNGNSVSNTVVFISGQDPIANTAIVTHKDVGISISNTAPTGEFQFGVGSNLFVNTYSSNVLSIEGNVNAQKMTLGTISVTSAYGLNHVTAQGSATGDTISLSNVTTGLEVTSNITAGGNVTAETVITSANVEVGNRLKFASNVFVDDLRIADLAANLVTYDKTTGELMDSGGLFANKLAVVSVQPPSALTANATTIAKHGTYTVTTSSLAENSNAWNAFDGDSAVEWTSSPTVGHLYSAGESTYAGTSNLFTGNYIQPGVSSAGEWFAIEFPYKTTLRHMKLTPPATLQRYPASANVYATNDSLTWTEVAQWGDVDPVTSSNVQTVVVNATESFKKYAIVVTKANGGADNVALAKWDLFAESFSIDGGQISMAQQPTTGGETMMEQSGPHSRLPKAMPLRKFPEIEFQYGKLDANETTFTYTQAGYTVKGTNSNTGQNSGPGPGRTPWKAFSDLNDGGQWQPTGFSHDTGNNGSADNVAAAPVFGPDDTKGAWVSLELPKKIKLQSVYVKSVDPSSSTENVRIGKLYGSNNNSDWVTIKDDYTLTYSGSDANDTVNSTTAYKYIVFQIRATGGSTQVQMNKIRYYGYEEDPPLGDTSVDTTFTSIMNTPQTTGAQVYVDGSLGETFTNRVVGPTVSNTHTTYVSAEKYWELSGNVESNVTLEANTFLSGDAPHSISMWFNSSNLEANVSNTCVFSISDQEHLNSENLKLQSNTWHNLTYAYQGEGGSRVTYLDGRKVAEDQAEDTFGAYPPFDMTGYSQGGYVASASSEYLSDVNNQRPAYNLYLSGSWYNDAWQTEFGTFNPNAVGGNTFTDSDGGTHTGHWNKLKLPYKLKPSYLYFKHYGFFTSSRNAANWVILGSNNDSDWDLLHSSTTVLNATKSIPITATKGYTYLMFLCKSVNGDSALFMGEIRYYGHRENDLVRLPDPTNVLKYPHIAMTGPAQRGYVASASSQYSDLYKFYYAFNNIAGPQSGGSWLSTSLANTYGGGSGAYGTVRTANLGSDSGGSATPENGEWLKIQMPHAIIVSHIRMKGTSDTTAHPKSFKLYGSNNGTSWTEILSEVGVSVLNTAGTQFTPTSTPDAYNYFGLVVTATQSRTTYTDVAELEIYGTEEATPVPIQIGGGNIDKVANFRVYDKFIGEDQALEIWDAQKDEFGRAKSSMTLHKGRLGIGTTEPEGRLAVADEPRYPIIEEFPPRGLGDSLHTYIEGHGVFKVYASLSRTGINGAVNVFDKKSISSSGSFWLVGDGAGYNTTTGIYEGQSGVFYHLATETPMGHYVTLEMPYRIKLEKYSFGPRYGVTYQTPKDWELWGSNDGFSWTKIHNVSGNVDDKQTLMYSVPQQTEYYKYMGFIVTKTVSGSADYMAIGELKYFGTREQGQSVLHDGQLTLTKNLNVPRIGPALDADDTPRRDRLVVEYNTSTNPTFEGAVRDTSGRGLDGVLGSVTYDAVRKSLETFSSGGIKTMATNNLLESNGKHSFSAWMRFDSPAAWEAVYGIGANIAFTGNNDVSVLVSTNAFRIETRTSGTYYSDRNYTFTPGKWVHMAVVYDGTGGLNGFDIYMDTVKLAQGGSSNGTASLNLPTTNLSVHFGQGSENSPTATPTYVLDGGMSSIKFYDTVLTAEEVKTLYDMGRCDEGHHVVNFSKTRVGIGLGDGEAPTAALDVRGENVVFNPQYESGTSSGRVGIGTSSPNSAFNFHQGTVFNGGAVPFGGSFSMTAYNPTGTVENVFSLFINSNNDLILGYGYNYDGNLSGTVGYFTDQNTDDHLNNFTGQHRTFIKDVPFSQVGELEGLIVSSDQNKYIKMSGGIEAGSNAITTNESLPIVSLSATASDKRCFGVISASEDPEERSDAFGSFVTPYEKEKGDTRVYINSVGEGAIWVSNIGGNLEAGDYITTSNVAGYGQKQDDDILHNYTVAKITMDCDFNPATQPVQQILRSNVIQTYYLGDVHKVKSVPHEFVTTTVGADDTWSNVSVSPSDVTYAEWSNLEANTQNTYNLTYTQTSNVVYDTKYTLTTTANVTESDPWDSVFVDPPDVTYAQYSNLEANTQSSYSLTFTKTTTDEKTPDEWSALESNTQSLYNMVYYQSVEEEVASDYPGATTHTRVTDVIENELDAHGQIQWEDHATETEKAYKIRYLDASGAQTDSANAVHIAAFVGCTYHCG